MGRIRHVAQDTLDTTSLAATVNLSIRDTCHKTSAYLGLSRVLLDVAVP